MLVFDPTITFSFLLSVAAIVFAWFRTRRQAVDKRFEAGSIRMAELKARLDRHDNRLLNVERDVAALPGEKDIHNLQLEMAKMAGSLDSMNATMVGNQKLWERLEKVVTRHEDHLLEQNK